MIKIDILNLEWPENKRDSFVIAPILIELRRRGFSCISGDIFSYIDLLNRYRPKILLITSFQGAKINDWVCRIASSLGIKIISLMAEGNLREEVIDYMTWGNNLDRTIYFEKLLVWSDRSRDLIVKHFPTLEKRVSTVGAVGFDRYKYLKFKEKESFLNENGFDYRKIIGFAGWSFDMVHDTPYFRKHKQTILKNFRPGQLELHRLDLEKIRRGLVRLVSSHQDVLFIARPHPSVLEKGYDEFQDIKKFKNVYYASPKSCEYSISDLINIADVWGGYETTTILEAWLLGKETFLYNPSGKDFNRDELCFGTFIAQTEDDLMKVFVDPINFSRNLLERRTIEIRRQEIIKNSIGFDDGLNFKRAAGIIEKVALTSPNPIYNSSMIKAKLSILQNVKYHLSQLQVIRRLLGLRKIDNLQIENIIRIYEPCLPNTYSHDVINTDV